MEDSGQTELSIMAGGQWLVRTRSGSRHLFDLDTMTYARRTIFGGRLDGAVRHEILDTHRMPRLGSRFLIEVTSDNPDWEAEEIESGRVVSITPYERAELATDVLPLMTTKEMTDLSPVNAWMVLGDDASYPTQDELKAQRLRKNPGLWQWTVPRQTQRGDLVFIYFMTPRKAIHFAARALCSPVYDSTIEVNAEKPVDPHQWWAWLSPFVEVPPVPISRLRELHGGHLILQGKPTNYLTPSIVSQIIDGFGQLNPEQDAVLQLPVGEAELPSADRIGLEELRRIAAGVLHPETKVEQYVAEPLLRLCFAESAGYRIERQQRIPQAGVADYGIYRHDSLVGTVEVKIGVRRQPSGELQGSPDFTQALGYATAAGVRGFLIDANEVFLVDPGKDAPVRGFQRIGLTQDHLAAITAHICGPALRNDPGMEIGDPPSREVHAADSSVFAEYVEWVPRALPRLAEMSTTEIADVVKEVVDVEGPICTSRLYALLNSAAGGARTSQATKSAIDKAIASLAGKTVVAYRGPRGGRADGWLRTPSQPEVVKRKIGPRSVDDIPMPELEQAMADLTVDYHEAEEVFRALMAEFGMSRLTKHRRSRFEQAYSALVL